MAERRIAHLGWHQGQAQCRGNRNK